MKILGIVTRTHDSGLALLDDGVATIVLEEERFNREKHTTKFPFRSLKAAFDGQGLGVDDIDVITTPWEMKSLRRNMFWAVAEGLPASLHMIPPSARPHVSTLIVAVPMGLRWGLMWHFGMHKKLLKIVQVKHHDAHAAIFFASPFEEAAVLVMDGHGDETAQSAYIGSGNRLQRLWQSEVFRLARLSLYGRHGLSRVQAVRGRDRDGARRHRPGRPTPISSANSYTWSPRDGFRSIGT